MRIPILLAALGIALILSTWSVDARACVIESDNANIDALVISPAGEESFSLTVRNLPLQVRPEAEGRAEVTLLAPLAFATTHSINGLDIRVVKPTSLLDGRIVVGKQVAPRFLDMLAPRGDEVEIELPLTGLIAETPIRMPCASLTVGHDRRNTDPSSQSVPNTDMRYIHNPKHLPLYAHPDEVSAFWFSFDGPLQVIGSKEGWLQVKAEWDNGSILRGWVPEALAPVRNGRPVQRLSGLGSIGLGSCGSSHGPSLNAFKLRAATPIHSRAKGAIWAHTASAIKVQAFPLSRSDGWIQIASLDGLPPQACSQHNHIWVHARDLEWTAKPL